MTGKEAGEITLHSLQVGQKQNLIPVWAINISVCFELKQRSIYKPSPWTRKDIYLQQCKVIWQPHLARRPVFGWGSLKLLWNAATSKVYCYLYIYKGYVSVHVEVITRSVWCFFSMEFVRPANTNKWTKEIKDRIYEWKMLTLKNCSSECSKHDNGNFICKMSINKRDHIVLIFYNYFL